MDIHAFVICAYGESEYLEECIKSLVNQSRRTAVYMATSTPNEHIVELSKKYNIRCFINDKKTSMCDDWNFACNSIEAEWITVAHQDDVYDKEYAKSIYDSVISVKEKSTIVFSDYRALIDNEIVDNINCKIRRFLRWPMKIRSLSYRSFFKRSILAFGNSVCCPTVTYHKSDIVGDIFTTSLQYNNDWDTFLRYADEPGRFIYINKPLVYYRVHRDATSAKYIHNNMREIEDIYMFEQFWPKGIVKVLMFFYKLAYAEYE